MSQFAILIPTYNNAATISDTLRSLQEQIPYQLLDYLQVYIADDGSDDFTLQLVRDGWSSSRELIILKNDINQGQWPNVNSALAKIINDGNEWVLILHSDDWTKPEWLQVMLEKIKTCSEKTATICSSWDVKSKNGKYITGEHNDEISFRLIQGDRSSVKNTVLGGCWWHISGAAIRLSAIVKIGFFNPKFQFADWEWLLRCLHSGWAIEYIPQSLIIYREHSQSVSSISFKKNLDVQESLELVFKYRLFISPPELVQFHLKKEVFLIRRLGKSLLRLQWKRAWNAACSFFAVLLNLVKCFWNCSKIHC